MTNYPDFKSSIWVCRPCIQRIANGDFLSGNWRPCVFAEPAKQHPNIDDPKAKICTCCSAFNSPCHAPEKRHLDLLRRLDDHLAIVYASGRYFDALDNAEFIRRCDDHARDPTEERPTRDDRYGEAVEKAKKVANSLLIIMSANFTTEPVHYFHSGAIYAHEDPNSGVADTSEAPVSTT